MARLSIELRLGARIRARREARGWSQAALAEAVELTPNYVGMLERGEGLPTVQTLISIARALGVSADTLLGEETGRDEWLDRLLAVAEAIPVDQRPLALALLNAVVVAAKPDAPTRPPRKRTARKTAR